MNDKQIEIVYKNIDDLKMYDKNPRKNDASVDAVAMSIKEYGFKVPVVIDKDGVIITGHTRVKAARKLRQKSVPCIVADDLSEAKVKAFRIADNKVGEASEWDMVLERINAETTEKCKLMAWKGHVKWEEDQAKQEEN